MPNPRFVPARNNPVFGGWLIRDTVTGILFNANGPWMGLRSTNAEDFTFRRDAQFAADMWNRIMADHPMELQPAFVAFVEAQVAA